MRILELGNIYLNILYVIFFSKFIAVKFGTNDAINLSMVLRQLGQPVGTLSRSLELAEEFNKGKRDSFNHFVTMCMQQEK